MAVYCRSFFCFCAKSFAVFVPFVVLFTNREPRRICETGTVMLNLLFLGQNRVKMKISTLDHMYNIPDNPMRRDMKCIYGTESYSCLILDDLKTLSPNLKQKLASFFKFQSISILSNIGRKQPRIASVHFNGYWQQTYTIIFWSSLMLH